MVSTEFGVLGYKSVLFQLLQMYTARMDKTINTDLSYIDKTILISVKADDKKDERKKHKLPFY